MQSINVKIEMKHYTVVAFMSVPKGQNGGLRISTFEICQKTFKKGVSPHLRKFEGRDPQDFWVYSPIPLITTRVLQTSLVA